nr:MAG TPA: hypothetical protein [Caudoviricetes sp.]
MLRIKAKRKAGAASAASAYFQMEREGEVKR